jgi:hypothetical protein
VGGDGGVRMEASIVHLLRFACRGGEIVDKRGEEVERERRNEEGGDDVASFPV